MLSRWKWKSIPDIKIIRIEEEKSFPFSFKGIYHIEVRDGLDSWTVIRKYDEFSMIHQYVHSQNIPYKEHLILPPKIGIFSKSDETLIKKNITLLEAYIKHLIYVPEILHSTEFRNFLIPSDFQPKRIDHTNLFILPTPPKDLILPNIIKIVSSCSTETNMCNETSEENDIDVFYLDQFLEAAREQLLFISEFKIKIDSSECNELNGELSPKFCATLSSLELEIKELYDILNIDGKPIDNNLAKYLKQCLNKLEVALKWGKEIAEKIEEKDDLNFMKWVTNIDQLEKDVEHMILENNISQNQYEEMLEIIQNLKSKVSVQDSTSKVLLDRIVNIETIFKECILEGKNNES